MRSDCRSFAALIEPRVCALNQMPAIPRKVDLQYVSVRGVVGFPAWVYLAQGEGSGAPHSSLERRSTVCIADVTC